ncbi:hypothetical protein HK102_001320, partial [Quaeritorhiza haematococci]
MSHSTEVAAPHAPRKGEECVDYLSYQFNPFDLHQCWRNATKKKDSIINGRRLENASWRKFFQMKYKLRTIDPAALNWQKDSDVCWLYGPFLPYEPLKELEAKHAAAVKAQQYHGGLKPVLKKRDEFDFWQSLREELLRNRTALELNSSETSPVSTPPSAPLPTSATTPPSQDTTANDQSPPFTGLRPDFYVARKSPYMNFSQRSMPHLHHPGRMYGEDIAEETSPDPPSPDSTGTPGSGNKLLRFADEVEQRLIVDSDEEADTDESGALTIGRKTDNSHVRRDDRATGKKFSISLGGADEGMDDSDDEDDESNNAISLQVLPKGADRIAWVQERSKSPSQQISSRRVSSLPHPVDAHPAANYTMRQVIQPQQNSVQQGTVSGAGGIGGLKRVGSGLLQGCKLVSPIPTTKPLPPTILKADNEEQRMNTTSVLPLHYDRAP